MKIIIAGAGEIGYHLAKLLSMEAHDIYVIDNKAQRLNHMNTHLDVFTKKGDAASIEVLEAVGIGDADLLVAVTEFQHTNLTIAGIGKRLGAKKTIARISNTEYIKSKEINFSEVGIDYMISPEELAANEIEILIKETAFNDKFEFEKGALSVLGAKLSIDSNIVGSTVQEIRKKYNFDFIVIAVKRENSNQIIIPRGNTIFEVNDQVYFSVPRESLEKIHLLVDHQRVGVKDVMILGGGRIGQKIAKRFCSKNLRVKMIEQDREKCFDLSDTLKNTLVIHGDGRDIELLEEESLDTMDAFVAVSGSSETNIMTSLVAKSKGVKKTIALVENMNYMGISQNIGVDTLINKKILAASAIFRHVRKGRVLALANLHNVEAEVLEFFVRRNTKITENKIKDLNLPENTVLGGVVRSGVAQMTFGDFTIMPGDRAIVFCLPDAIPQVEKLFNN
ncbi:Trk system potassium transporter TrkA [Wenyingzhuangia sp. 2_MG-2023]|uniref:Trk system potassium transporter TrkA n=1 Tax=Wenyingzhuangia sp. 2_MG-2023 TaxID=3062639 RepID=UPI0026E2C4F5|nr:Trk system potassium transporter TrkA [Wenyingzhuangia sp. 2_MG-2023]MDO6736388.1 Trk system potassium transporter TrkA [Wenyingzhuangia sp. 2_MG-2023]MDO6801301.1 Trk system potassium transporter TrkA [Wenyingzhuangia sp. 1_MG-2023]